MLTELLGKGGQVCQHAKRGDIKCPLIIRPTSEDVVTGQLFGVLGAINPRWWLPQLLNRALGTERFRQQVFRRFEIALWKNRPPYPRELLPWDEGSTQVDVTITWENPPTTVFFEVKFGSELSTKTTGDDGTHGYPSDQLIRNIRVGLLECGWLNNESLFEQAPRQFAVIVLARSTGNSLVKKYRDTAVVQAAIPHSQRLRGLPVTPFVGELSYQHIVQTLSRQQRWLGRPERRLAQGLIDYLEFKLSQMPNTPTQSRLRQANLPVYEAVS